MRSVCMYRKLSQTRINYLKKELPPIVKKLGHLPKRNELRAIKRYDIVTNANNIGGLINAYKILNFHHFQGQFQLYSQK